MGFGLNELRSLAAALPPSERVMAGEVADVVSALVAVATHGEELVKAAEDGYNGISEFLHGKAVTQAEDAGTPVPERGQVTQTAPPAPGPSGITQAIDYTALADAIVAAQDRKQNLPPDAAVPAPAHAEGPAPGQGSVTEGTPEADGPLGNDPAARGNV